MVGKEEKTMATERKGRSQWKGDEKDEEEDQTVFFFKKKNQI